MPFGRHQGAILRVGDARPVAPGVAGESGWAPLGTEFTVTEAGTAVRLICELRASGGEALFDRNSLTLTRLE